MKNDRSRPRTRPLNRFEVRGREKDKALVREVARLLAGDGETSASFRAQIVRFIEGECSPIKDSLPDVASGRKPSFASLLMAIPDAIDLTRDPSPARESGL